MKQEPLATSVEVSGDTLSVELADGRTIATPLTWYPRLAHATPEERKSWRLIGGGLGIHWPAIDEDISVVNLLAGQPSAESQRSLQSGWPAGLILRGSANNPSPDEPSSDHSPERRTFTTDRPPLTAPCKPPPWGNATASSPEQIGS